MAVECGRGSISSYTYVLTRTGVLCKFGHDRSLDQFVNVQVCPYSDEMKHSQINEN